MSDLVCNRCLDRDKHTIFIVDGTTWCDECHEYECRIESEENAFSHLREILEAVQGPDIFAPTCFECSEEDKKITSRLGRLFRWFVGAKPATHITQNCTVVCDDHFTEHDTDLDFKSMLEELDVLHDNAPWLKKEEVKA